MLDNKIIMEDINKIVETVGDEFSKLEGKTILITGASGYLPSYLVDSIAVLNKAYLKKPCKVLAVSRSKVKENDRLGHLLNHQDIKFIEQDVSKPFHLNEPVHYIVHAASKASPRHYLKYPLDTMNTNVDGLRYLLEMARENLIESFLYFSSGEIYGNPPPENLPTPETYFGNVSCISDRACYTEAKRFSETICKMYYMVYRLPVKWVRPFHIYGPGMKLNDGRVMSDFIKNGAFGEDITLLSEGKASRAFCYISDATIYFWKVLLSDYNGEVFNVGNNKEEITIKDLAILIRELFDNKVSVKINMSNGKKYVAGSPDRSCSDISKIKSFLGYEPKINLRAGLVRTISWYKDNIEILKHQFKQNGRGGYDE